MHFSDIPSSSPYYEAVSFVSGQGIMSGYPNGKFNPDHVVTWAEAFWILHFYLIDSSMPPEMDSSDSFDWFLQENPAHKWVQSPIYYFCTHDFPCQKELWSGHLDESVSCAWFIKMIESSDWRYHGLSDKFLLHHKISIPPTRATIAEIIYKASKIKAKHIFQEISIFFESKDYNHILQYVKEYKLYIPCFPPDISLLFSLISPCIYDNHHPLNLIQLEYMYYLLKQKYTLRFSKSIPKSLYHYTSLSSLEKLSSGSKFRAYHVDYLNDPKEGKLLKPILDEFHLMEKYSGWSYLKKSSTGIFIASFINNEMNSLPMWSQYGSQYTGCRLEISPSDFPEDLDLYTVQYDEKKIKVFLTSIFDILDRYEVAIHSIGYNIAFNYDPVFWFAREILYFISYLYKSAAFQNENEVRVLMFSTCDTALSEDPSQGYRNGEFFPRIYKEIDFPCLNDDAPNSPIYFKRILLGPKVFKPNWVKISLMQRGYDENSIQENELELQ